MGLEHLKLSAIIKNIPIGLLTAAPDGAIEEYNASFLTALNLSSIENIRTLNELHKAVLKSERREYSSITQKLLDMSNWVGAEFALNINGLDKQYKLQKTVISREGESFFVMFSILETSKIARDNELSAWREISRKLAHEIKNPLLPIQISAERLRLQSGNTRKIMEILPESIDNILSSVDMINKLVTDFSKFAKLTDIKKESVDIVSLLEEIFKDFAEFHDVKFALEYDKKPIISGDRPRLGYVFNHLIKNGIEALDKKGEIRVKIEENDGFVVIHFFDNGPGIDREILSKLFKPYFTTKTDGTGLGLTMVYRIIELHKGGIEFAPADEGAHFILRLPARRF